MNRWLVRVLQDAENDWNEREAEANERQAQLRAEIDAQEASVEEALVAAEAAKAKVPFLLFIGVAVVVWAGP